MKVFAVVAVWGNTKNNHAGMYYLAKKLREKFKGQFIIIPTPTKGSRFLFTVYKLYNYILGIYLKFRIKKDDIVFLMEYFLPETEQSVIYKLLCQKVEVRALAHLVPDLIRSYYSDQEIKNNTAQLSKLYVLGSSLKKFFCTKHIPEDKIKTTFHYVDTDYYRNIESVNKRLRCICMGSMERDYTALNYLIAQNPQIDFIVCKGKTKKNIPIENFPNLIVYGFVSEDELLKLMQTSDISLNLMKDTIGSNVITTSLACGLVVLASNVGSIKDYIEDKHDGLLFESKEECDQILKRLDNDRNLLGTIKRNAVSKANKMNLNNFYKWFRNEFYRQ